MSCYYHRCNRYIHRKKKPDPVQVCGKITLVIFLVTSINGHFDVCQRVIMLLLCCFYEVLVHSLCVTIAICYVLLLYTP